LLYISPFHPFMSIYLKPCDEQRAGVEADTPVLFMWRACVAFRGTVDQGGSKASERIGVNFEMEEDVTPLGLTEMFIG
jgi:hypothetical protein